MTHGMDAPAGQRPCEEHPEWQKRRLVSQNVLSKKAAPQMAAGMGHFKLTGSRPTKAMRKAHEATAESPSSTVLFDDIVKNVASLYPQLTIEVGVRDGRKWGIIHGGIRIEPNSQTPVHNPRAVISSGGDSLVTFKFEVMLVPQVRGDLPEDNEHFLEVLQTLLPGSGYFLCQGLPSEVASLMTYDTKSARRWGLPFGRVDHQECPLWVKEASSSTSSQGHLQRCEKCTKLMYYIRREEKRRKSLTPEQMAKRVMASSHCPLKYLSPANAQTRRRNIAQEKKARKRKAAALMTSSLRSPPTVLNGSVTSTGSAPDMT